MVAGEGRDSSKKRAVGKGSDWLEDVRRMGKANSLDLDGENANSVYDDLNDKQGRVLSIHDIYKMAQAQKWPRIMTQSCQ